MTIQERAQEIEKSIIDDSVNNDFITGLEAFRFFIASGMTTDDYLTLKDIVNTALQAPFTDRHKPINALVRRAIEWQAERLARLEQE